MTKVNVNLEGTNFSSDPYELLVGAQFHYDEARDLRLQVLELARREGLSWYVIGDALGMSNVAARRLALRNNLRPAKASQERLPGHDNRTATNPGGPLESSHERKH